MSNYSTNSFEINLPGRNNVMNGKFSIPRLEEVLTFCKSYNLNMSRKNPNENNKLIGLYIEIKYPEFYNKNFFKPYSSISQKFLEVLKKYDLDDADKASKSCPIVIECFS